MTNPSTITLCGSLSRHPVSLGAAMHNAGYRALGLSYTYVPFAVEDLEGALRGMRALGIRGFGVSMPFKLQVMPLLDRVDEIARRIGAVNTVVNDAGVLSGHNTDAWGAARALEEALPLRGRRALLVGAGGAARAVAHALCAEGMRVHIVNRTPEKAFALAAHVARAVTRSGPLDQAPASGSMPRATGGGLEALGDLGTFDVVINASSAGMREYGAESPLDESVLRPSHVVMDIVYEPLDTALLAAARAVGAKTIHGGRMLLHQAARQFELYTGASAPLEAMAAALENAIAPT